MREQLQSPCGLLGGKGQRGHAASPSLPSPWGHRGPRHPQPTPGSAAPPHPPAAPGSVSRSHRHPQRAELDAGAGGRLHREPEGGSLPALAGVWQRHRRHPLLPRCVVGGSGGQLPGGGGGLAKGILGPSHREMRVSIPWEARGTRNCTVPKPIGVSSPPEPAASLAMGIPLPCPPRPPVHTPGQPHLTYHLPSPRSHPVESPQ